MSLRSYAKPSLRFALLTAAIAACFGTTHAQTTIPAAARIDPAHWPQPTWPLPADPALEQRISALMATMTVEEKVGQIIQGDIGSITPDDVRKYRLGSILAGGSSDPGGKYNAPARDWSNLADAFWQASMDTSHGGKAIPIIWGIDAVHGQSNIVGATLFPHNVGLGATRDPELIREIGRITAAETRATGMEWTFAPTVAVPQDTRWGRAYEGYSENPAVVAALAPAMVEGLQGKAGSAEFLDDRHVLTTVKHFLGDGGTTNGKDQGDTAVSEAALRDIHAAGYIPAIAAGAQSVMASFNSFHGEKMHGNKALLTGVLKERMNFGGFVVGDWNGHGQVKGCSNTDCAQTFNAGLDMAMAPDSWRGLYDSTLAHVKSGDIPMARLDDAVRRILRVKFRMGLFEKPKPSARALGGKFELLGAPEHRAVARRAVRESLVLLKNQGGLLPLSPGKRILLVGDGADNMAKQAGGWTLTWQGDGTKRSDFPNADTIWDGFRQQIEAAGGHAELAVDGRYKTKPDVAIVVFGEDPYAEFQGDIPNLLLKGGKSGDLERIRKLKADGIPVVAVFLSGRPLWMNREINAADAFVAAWLPGSEGAGIADVLLRGKDGKPQHDFHGKLSFSWPAYANNSGQSNHAPLFPFGHGLTYADNGNLAAVSEDSGISLDAASANVWFERGLATSGFTLQRDGAVTMTTINTEVQEGARRFVFAGNGMVGLRAGAPMDLARETNGDVLVIASLRVDALPKNATVAIGAGCGHGCRGEVAIGSALAALPQNQWTRLAVPLKCLRKSGADTRNLDMPFYLRGGNGIQLALAKVMLGTEFDRKVECASD